MEKKKGLISDILKKKKRGKEVRLDRKLKTEDFMEQEFKQNRAKKEQPVIPK